LNWASEVFCEHLAQRRHVQHLFCQQLLELAVLLLERLQPLGFRDLEAAVLRAPGVEGGVADPAWCSFNKPMICSSLNLLLRTVRLLL
jgi:hypothetical protein